MKLDNKKKDIRKEPLKQKQTDGVLSLLCVYSYISIVLQAKIQMQYQIIKPTTITAATTTTVTSTATTIVKLFSILLLWGFCTGIRASINNSKKQQ